MTNDEFAAWLRVEFDSISAAEKALEIDRDTLKSMMSGVRRKSGLPHPIPKGIIYFITLTSARESYTLFLSDREIHSPLS